MVDASGRQRAAFQTLSKAKIGLALEMSHNLWVNFPFSWAYLIYVIVPNMATRNRE